LIPPAPASDRARALRDLALLFLRLGATAFGGPPAHIALMEDEVVRRRGWLSREELLDLLGAANLVPGPNSTELAIHIGHRRAGLPGLLVAGACFILPAALLVSALAWAYVRFGSLPALQGVLRGVKPVVVAIVLQALIGFGRTAIRRPSGAAVAVAAAAAAALGANELLVIAGGGLLLLGERLIRDRSSLASLALLNAVDLGAALPAAGAFSRGALFLVFLKIGSVLYGSGYVLLAFLRSELVVRLGWLSEAQLLDAVAVGQVTPGPLFTTATFVGYVLGGGVGAALATLGIFLPAFLFVAVSGPLVPRLRRSPLAAAFLDGVNLASLALMAVVTAQLGWATLRAPLGLALFVVSAALLLLRRVGATWLVLGGAGVGAALSWLSGHI
jgi:chromate transporter